MKVKRIVSVVVSAVFLLSLCACSKTAEKDNKSLYLHGMDIIDLMSEMTKSEEYIDIYTGSNDIKEIAAEIGSYDYSVPDKVYALSLTDETLSAMAELESIENASEELQKVLKSRVLSSLMTQINGMAGAEKLAASSVCTMGKTFVNAEMKENVIYLYTFEDAYPVAITFISGEDGAVTASGTFVLYDKFTCSSEDEIRSFFSEIPIEIEEITIE